MAVLCGHTLYKISYEVTFSGPLLAGLLLCICPQKTRSTIFMNPKYLKTAKDISLAGAFAVSLPSFIGSGFCLLMGVLILVLSSGDATKRFKALKEAEKTAISTTADTIYIKNNEKLVHVIGKLASTTTLRDSLFNVKADSVSALVRTVSMYQWLEYDSLVNGTRYEKHDGIPVDSINGDAEVITKYRLVDTTIILSSEYYKDSTKINKTEKPFSNLRNYSDSSKLGRFTIYKPTVSQVSSKKELPLQSSKQYPLLKNEAPIVVDNKLFYGKDPTNPQAGDVTVSFTVAPTHTVTVLAKQSSNSLVPYKAKSGYDLNILYSGGQSFHKLLFMENFFTLLVLFLCAFFSSILLKAGLFLFFKPIRLFTLLLKPEINLVMMIVDKTLSWGIAIIVLLSQLIPLCWYTFS